MVGGEEELKQNSPKQSENGEAKRNSVFSPGFRSVAEMAGWDEEALLMASSLVVEDTPDRDFKQKRRSDPLFKTPPTHSRRKRRDQKKSPVSKFVDVLNLEEECSKKEEKKDEKTDVDVKDKKVEKSDDPSSGNALIPCIDRLREELSCAICLEICFEPSTTSCGHSFCKKCLKSAADKCGKRCPKCRQLISNGRSCTINTVLWNTIQLLFPQEIEARKAVAGILESGGLQSPPTRRKNQYRSVIQALNSPEGEQLGIERRRRTSNQIHQIYPRQQSFRPASVVFLNSREAGDNSVGRRRRRDVNVAVEEDQDAALALRLQQQEFMGAFGGSGQTQQVQQQNSRRSVATASVNLRAMASRAINIRNMRGR
uniref:LON peptidase N-terminal domain and RING finger protein 3-like isoform X2 n=1 Tax=Erigeron canadensis TaxID=72917 RepID=UPI001CB8E46D|nr:LON peptidase N-terminal domain and RING finger protein 3-like isoform X2 [Erigeron canadensis]